MNGDALRHTVLVAGLLQRHGGRKTERALFTKNTEESGDAIRVRDVRRRENPAVHEREIAVRHLTPLPSHALPESPVVIVIARRIAHGHPIASDREVAVDAPRQHRPRLEMVRRRSTFEEVVQDLDEGTALYEARRCLSCGGCIACDNCYGVCPDNAVIKLEPGGSYQYEVDYDFCKGCGICAEECPCGAIKMEPERT